MSYDALEMAQMERVAVRRLKGEPRSKVALPKVKPDATVSLQYVSNVLLGRSKEELNDARMWLWAADFTNDNQYALSMFRLVNESRFGDADKCLREAQAIGSEWFEAATTQKALHAASQAAVLKQLERRDEQAD